MSKIVLSNVADLTQTTTAATTINANSATIQTAMDNTLSRDGTSPNQMGASLDMNNNQIINLPSPGTSNSPVRLVDINSTLTPTPAILSGNNVYSGNNSFTGTNTFGTNATTFTGDAYFKSGDPWYDVKAFGAVGNGSVDDTAAIQAAINAAAGKPVFLPPGTYRVTSQLHYVINSQFSPGLKLFGAGPEITFIDNQCSAGSSCLFAGSNTINIFMYGGFIRDLTVKSTTGSGQAGIELRGVYQYTVENIRVNGLAGNGMMVTSSIGDGDASNELHMRNCRFENCGGAGFLCNFSNNAVQTSFMRFDDCFFNANVLAGLYWSGLQGTMINCAFTENNGPGLWIVFIGANNAQFSAMCNSFENNAKSGGYQVRIDSLEGGDFIGNELALTDLSGLCQGGVILGSTGTGFIGNVRFEGTRVRILPNFTPNTLYYLASANCALNVINNTFYQAFDAAGQTRYVVTAGSYGNRLSDSFDAVQVGSGVGVSALTGVVNGSNENVVVPLDGTMFLLSGPSSAFSIGGFTNGFDGRKLELHNATGQTLTINSEDAGSSTFNRIRTNGGVAVTVNSSGTVSFRYNLGIGRWLCTGVG